MFALCDGDTRRDEDAQDELRDQDGLGNWDMREEPLPDAMDAMVSGSGFRSRPGSGLCKFRLHGSRTACLRFRKMRKQRMD